MIIMSLFIFGVAGWFFYDGMVAWPSEEERFQVYDQLATEMIEGKEALDTDDSRFVLAWRRVAEEKGWKEKPPKHRSDAALKTQVMIGGLFALGGVIFASWVVWNHTLSIRAEGEFVYSARGKKVPLDAIVEMDRRKWKNKGIAVAIYEENGRRRKLILDDYKFEGTEPIILEAERRIAERSGGGVPEEGREPEKSE